MTRKHSPRSTTPTTKPVVGDPGESAGLIRHGERLRRGRRRVGRRDFAFFRGGAGPAELGDKRSEESDEQEQSAEDHERNADQYDASGAGGVDRELRPRQRIGKTEAHGTVAPGKEEPQACDERNK